jgi:hypothetical protein
MMMMIIITLDAMSEMNSLHIVEERCDVYHSQDVHVVPCNLTERAQIQKLIQGTSWSSHFYETKIVLLDL